MNYLFCFSKCWFIYKVTNVDSVRWNGAPLCTRIVVHYLNRHFNGRWIERNGPVWWSARSPDLTLQDFYLWQYLKNVVYERGPTTKKYMIERIRLTCANIPRNVLQKNVRHFQRRIDLCIQEKRNVIEHLLQ